MEINAMEKVAAGVRIFVGALRKGYDYFTEGVETIKLMNLGVMFEANRALKKLTVRFPQCERDSASNLYFQDKLMGWCWETTNFVAPFLRDKDIVVRGRLENLQGGYEHGWLELLDRRRGDFVLDPALSIFCEKDKYYDVMNPSQYGQVEAGTVKQFIIDKWQTEERSNRPRVFDEKEYISINGTDDANSPIFRGSYAVSPKINGGEIKGIDLHCYYSDC